MQTMVSSLSKWRIIVAVACLLPAPSFASLKWEALRIEVMAQPGAKEAIGLFHFVNAGDSPVTITSVQPSCGCTTAELAKHTYAPNEAGEIKAVLNVGDRVGLQEKTILVTTQNAPTAPTTLMLRVTIPALLTYSPRLLLWRTAEALTEKSVIVTDTGPKKLTEINAAPDPKATATSRIEMIEAGFKYRISIKPSSIEHEANWPVVFTAKFIDNTTQQFRVFVLVR